MNEEQDLSVANQEVNNSNSEPPVESQDISNEASGVSSNVDKGSSVYNGFGSSLGNPFRNILNRSGSNSPFPKRKNIVPRKGNKTTGSNNSKNDAKSNSNVDKKDNGVTGSSGVSSSTTDVGGSASNTDTNVSGGGVAAKKSADVAGTVAKKGVKAAAGVVKLLITGPWGFVFVICIVIVFILFLTIFTSVFHTFDLFKLNPFGSGSSSGVSCSYDINGINISDIKVRLLDCAGYTPISGEELIDFETYIIGVVYQESGGASYEALKAQAVAARGYALKRGEEMGGQLGTPGGGGVGLIQEDGQWILLLRSCTNDQVFCNPEKGCWSNRVGGQTSDSNRGDWSNCTVYSGYDTSKVWTRPALAEDSDIRRAVSETQGQVVIDSSGNIKYTPYVNTNQQYWNSLALQGKDYFEILVADYGSGIKIDKPSCKVSNSVGDGIATGKYIHPSPGTYITSPFGWRGDIGVPGASKDHKGIDLSSYYVDILAIDGGVVINTEYNQYRGYYLDIDHGNGIVSRYQHLDSFSVEVGDKVSQGDVVAKSGASGIGSGAHLHFEILENGVPKDPESFYPDGFFSHG